MFGAGVVVGLSFALSGVVHAWWGGGHQIFTLAALRVLPEDMPNFFRSAGTALADMSAEPDRWKDPAAPHLRGTEHPEHFIDLEYLEGRPLPSHRADLIKYYVSKGLDPGTGGYLPYAIQEGYERLMLAFKDYRKRPLAPEVQQRVIVYAGWLAHYCQDALMPLHTTRDYDGKQVGDKIVQKGLHAKIDGYPESNNFKAEAVSEGVKCEPARDVWGLILSTLANSFAQVPRCYALDSEGAFDTHPEKGREFILERAHLSAQFTAVIWYTAWKNSAGVAPQ